MMNNTAYPKGEGNHLKVAIKEEELTVALESRATLHIGILNESPNEDFFDILVKGVPAEWVTIHTPLLRLAAGEAKLVTLTIQPDALADNRIGQHPLEVRVVSQSDPKSSAVARSLVTVAAYQSKGRIGFMLGSIHFAATPGSVIDIPILLQNRGEEEDSLRLNVTGLPPNWVSTNSPITHLEPDTSAEIRLTLQIPRSSQATAGRHPFTIQVASQEFPTQTAEADCLLTVSAFSHFTASLEAGSLRAGEFGQVIVENEGNTSDTYSLSFQSSTNEMIFEKAVQVVRPGTQQTQMAFVEIPQGERFQVPAGSRGAYSFRTRLRVRQILGGEQTYPFTVNVRSTTDETAELVGQVNESAYLPFWFLPVGVGGLLLLCLLLMIPFRGVPTSARATQTAAFNQTQAALSGQGDSDGDGLANDRELALGTDPLVSDSDTDRLSDREEVDVRQTNPLDSDTDDDGLLDGDEIQTHLTDPRNPDMDGDTVLDGNEITRSTDPRSADTDGDGLRDNDEIRLETDPRLADSDGDGLRDGEENETCPRPRVPDSDNDGIIDGRDLNRCDPLNPSLTATAAVLATAQAPTVAPTLIPTFTSIPPTNPPPATLTPVPPSLQGALLFSSNRDGNSENYSLNLANQSLPRLTNSAAQDMQPALAPDSTQVVYVTNQDGNNEIYLGGLDGRVPLNLTNHAGDDQHPVWSPDGNWIAFTSNRDGNQEIYVMRRDGTELRNLTNNAANDFAPAWFSVGGLLGNTDWIAFTTTRDGNQEIYKVRPDGSSLTNLTRNPASDHSPTGFTGGSVLAFVSDRTGNSDIYVMTDSGGVPNNVTNNPAQDLDPVINPGGNWIAFASDREGNLEIYVIASNGGTAYNLTRNPSQDRYPDW